MNKENMFFFNTASKEESDNKQPNRDVAPLGIKYEVDDAWDTIPLEDSPLVWGDNVAPKKWVPPKRVV